MDGLRLALIIFGIAVVAIVYVWTSRRRRLDREAGNFDRFDAWTNEELDPLSPSAMNDAGKANPDTTDGNYERAYDDSSAEVFVSDHSDHDALTQKNLRLSEIQDALKEAREMSEVDDRQVQKQSVGAASGADSADRLVDFDDDRERDHAAPDAPIKRHQAKSRDTAPETIADLPAAASAERVAPRIGSLDEVEVSEQRAEPTLNESASAAAERFAEASASGNDYERDIPSSDERDELHASAELVVVLNVMARTGQTFDGPALKIALEAAGLKSGTMQLYHYRAETQTGDSPPIFSALNAVKPGTLDEHEFDGMRTPGVALILRMPGLERPSEAFELMLVAARRIADELNGQVCDDSRSTLTGQALNHLREQIAAVAFRAQSGH